MDLPPLIKAMLRPEFYPHRPGRVDLIQTHISYVLLAGDLVFKIKKPVDFGFLNFTTLRRRAYYCRRELELNRRLAPGLYLEVAAIRGQGEMYTLAKRGRVVEYAVVMRRIPDRRLLCHFLEEGRAAGPMLKEVARLLAGFHGRAATGRGVDRHGSPEAIAGNVKENLRQIRPFVNGVINRDDFDLIRRYSLGFLRRHRHLLTRRLVEGRIRDGHGDLHAEHVGWRLRRPFVFDCIEFNARFRCADVAADIAFLVMDLEYRGAWNLAEAFLEEYLKRSGDWEILPLLDFYLCYRACVRGKVDSLAGEDPHEPPAAKAAAKKAAGRYFKLAAAYARRDLRPMAVVMTGPAGSGKSTVADLFRQRLDFRVFSSDLIRKELAGLSATERIKEDYRRGLYSPRMSYLTYDTMLARAAGFLREGNNVVLDATFLRQKERKRARAAIRKAGARFFLVEVALDEAVLKERLAERERKPDTVSDARWDTYVRQKEAYQKPRGFDTEEHLTIDAAWDAENIYTALLRGMYPFTTDPTAIH